MGVLRLLLAVAVVSDHIPFYSSLLFVQSGTAVILFYVISGFYMTMVIAEKYAVSGTGWEWRFLSQRFLRLLPPYWFVLILTLAFYAWIGRENAFTSSLDMTGFQHALVVFSNVFVVGLDILVSGDLLLYQGIYDLRFLWPRYPVIIGWTVGVELTFYAFAAFFALRNRRNALIALGIGVYVRFYFLIANGKFIGASQDGLGYSNTPWGYHFFGIALIYFMFGWLSYQLYLYLQKRLAVRDAFMRVIAALAALMLGLIVWVLYAFDSLETILDYNDYRLWLILPPFILLVPPLFILTRNSAIDTYVGLYSYPVYLCHLLAHDAGVVLLGIEADNPLYNLMLVAGLAIIIVHLVEIPVEGLRKRVWSRHAGVAQAAP